MRHTCLQQGRASRAAQTIRMVTRPLAMLAALALAGPAAAQTFREVTVGLASPSMAVAGGRIAKELGLFEKHGIDVRFTIMESSASAVAGMIAGSFKFTIAGFPELLVAQTRGQKVVAVTTTYGGFATSMVLSKATVDKLGISPDAPIRDRLKALDGLVLATPSATAIGSVTYKNAALAAGGTMRMTYMTQPAMPAALETGAIQGYFSSAPFWATPIVKGQGVLWINGPRGDVPSEFTPTITAQLQTTRAFADANPDLMKAMRAVFADLAKAVAERPQEVKAAVAKLYPDLDARTLDLLYAAESLGWNPRPVTVQDIAREIAFVKATGMPLPQVESIDPASLLVP